MPNENQGNSVNPIFATTTRISFPNSDGHGTGFFYNRSDQTFLITNQHVIRDEEDGHEPDSFRFFVRGHSDLSQISWLDCSIEDGIQEDWYVHPEYPDADVAAVPLNIQLSPLSNLEDVVTGSLAFSANELMDDDERITGGDSALILSYPGTFVDKTTYFPVIRNARIASPYWIPFNGQPFFITDARMHSGTSGSPVLADPSSLAHSPRGIQISGRQVALLGVHSATFRQPDVDDPGEELLDLNAAWFAELVEEIIQNI